jgi:hypothetical protein
MTMDIRSTPKAMNGVTSLTLFHFAKGMPSGHRLSKSAAKATRNAAISTMTCLLAAVTFVSEIALVCLADAAAIFLTRLNAGAHRMELIKYLFININHHDETIYCTCKRTGHRRDTSNF